jgi:4-hydroxyphenylpyruvate dioxygenase
MMNTDATGPGQSENGDFPKLRGIDYLEFYVGNARQAAHFYRTAFGLMPIAYAGLETGSRDRTSFVVGHRHIRLVLTAALDPQSPIARDVHTHGDGIKDIAFTVDDAEAAFQQAVKRGARPVLEPTTYEDEEGKLIKATIGVYGDTVHSFIQRSGLERNFLPGYRALDATPALTPGELAAIDHVAISVDKGRLDEWIDYYKQVLGFHMSHEEDVLTELSAMNSKVVQSRNGRIKFPMMEPAAGRRKSQIEEYLNFYHGPGAQHVAFLSGDIVHSIRALRANHIEFLPTPGTYYDLLEERVGALDEDMGMLRELNILADRDKAGYLLQVFTRPLQSRPTVFMEVIQRKGAVGFGAGNIRALFEAIEREQAARGNV